MISITMFVISLVCLIVFVSSADVDFDNDINIIVKNDTRYPCDSDRDCPETDYCYERQYCVNCYICDKYRRNKAKHRCARKLLDCGPCITGYFELSVGPNRKVCVSPVTQAQPQLAENPENFFYNMKASDAIGIGAIAFLAVTAFASWHCYRRKRTVAQLDNQWRDFELAPPPRCSGTSVDPPAYEETQISSVSENSSAANSFNLRVTGHPESKLKAVPFQLPFGDHVVALAPPAYENSIASNESLADVPTEQSEVDHPIASSSSNLGIHDETTQPSAWTPGPSYCMTETNETDAANTKDEKVTPPNKRRKTNDS